MTIKAEIPYGAYWSTPFVRWQGSFAHLHSIEFAAHVVRQEIANRPALRETVDYGVLGLSVPQSHAFYGLPWLAGMAGLSTVGGPTLMQACATGVRCILAAAQEIQFGMARTALAITCDRLSNGPHIYYPNPSGPGGNGSSENWVPDNFDSDPLGGHAMVKTAENVAARHKISTAQQHDVVLRREEQYKAAIANDSAFLKRFMRLPFDVPSSNFKKTLKSIEGDEGIRFSTLEGLGKLKPVVEGGTVTFGGQTHPTDGNAAVVVATPEVAAQLSADPGIRVRIHGFGLARAELAYMPEAAIPAAARALAAAGKKASEMHAIKTHNPFAVNDLVFAASLGVDVMKMNNFGCSLVYGHPNAPTGMRGVIELIEELVAQGGGWGLFSGCAAGDTGMSIVIEVTGQ
ncbi:MAG: thiolase family protein [Rhodocyclaceae bacterium]|nr:thiolase family protein [Rhodocyclaceae bacterium]MBK6553127.1 thiolase family protein [Rhodocyclaceae bacterium]MBK9311448.1 thiolase family protein [Rhodocyclaceae bacterium]